MEAQRMIQLRAQKDKFFREHPQSPLTSDQKSGFTGLQYYIPMAKWDMQVDVTEFEEKENLQIQTTTGETRWYLRFGEFVVKAGGQEARLTIFKSPPDHFFLPFADANAGTETYPAGRYLEPVQLSNGQFHIDFNQAYNPYCAYSPKWSCPITPAENRISVAIPAGEKMPQGDWVIK
ncbi:MAG: DUF1684 domain-containing protein [Aggregatilineales bacterium]